LETSLVTWTFGGDATVLADYALTTTTTNLSQAIQHVKRYIKLIHSGNFLKMSNLETALLLLKIQTFIIVYNVVFILA